MEGCGTSWPASSIDASARLAADDRVGALVLCLSIGTDLASAGTGRFGVAIED